MVYLITWERGLPIRPRPRRRQPRFSMRLEFSKPFTLISSCVKLESFFLVLNKRPFSVF